MAAFVGDHNRPSRLLRPIQAAFAASCRWALPPANTAGLAENPFLTLNYDHKPVLEAARKLSGSWLGRRVRNSLETRRRPDVVGVSVFYSGQVMFGLVVTLIAKRLWPSVPVVWGAPHVTALEHEISGDAAYELAGIDGFVFGYAEATWVALLDAVASGSAWPTRVIAAGAGRAMRAQGDPSVVPKFDHLNTYGWGRLCLPTQATRGCAYGRCSYCTYPIVEGRYRLLPRGPVDAVVAQAAAQGAAAAFKDALITPRRLEELALRIDGRVEWAACTKLHPRLKDPVLMRRLRAGGLHTIEVGLETLTDDGQLLMNKRQALPLFQGFLDAAQDAGVAVVINYMTGLPGVCESDEAACLAKVYSEVAARTGLVAKVEHNTLQVERRSPMGQHPERVGIQVSRTWPWATVAGWRLAVPSAA